MCVATGAFFVPDIALDLFALDFRPVAAVADYAEAAGMDAQANRT